MPWVQLLLLVLISSPVGVGLLPNSICLHEALTLEDFCFVNLGGLDQRFGSCASMIQLWGRWGIKTICKLNSRLQDAALIHLPHLCHSLKGMTAPWNVDLVTGVGLYPLRGVQTV